MFFCFWRKRQQFFSDVQPGMGAVMMEVTGRKIDISEAKLRNE
jgi:hypothetical protein